MQLPYIIAEIGQNHQGDVYTAIRLVSAAMKAGADAVKFQLRSARCEYTPDQLAAPHPRPEHAFGSTYGQHRQALDLSVSELSHIKHRIAYNQWPIDFGVTPCHLVCVEPAVSLGLDFIKIASKDCENAELIRQAAISTDAPLIVSTGGARNLEPAVQWADVLMHCVRQYPTRLEDADLKRISELLVYAKPVGWSDHTGRPYLGGPAAALGASVFEAHITFSQNMKGTDHAASLTYDAFRHWAAGIRATWKAVRGATICKT